MNKTLVLLTTLIALIMQPLASTRATASQHSGIVQIYSGPSANFTCALLADDYLSCWGTNNWSGPPDYTFQYLSNTKQRSIYKIAIGYGFACALRTDSTVSCWGANDQGQLGDGSTVPYRSAPVPVRYDALNPVADAVDLTVGAAHACLIRSGGTVWCWGSNSADQLGHFGIPTTTFYVNPVEVVINDPLHGNPILGNVQSISAGGNTTCVLFEPDLTGSTGACWGDNSFGQFGHGTISSNEASPLTIYASGTTPLHMQPYSLQVGNFHTCALIPNSTTGCWGNNNEGATATKISGAYPWPASVYVGPKLLSTVTTLAIGGNSTCALLNDNSAACWGANAEGQVGNYKLYGADAFSPYTTIYSDGSSLENITTLVAGAEHACALLSDHTVACWGSNGRNQIGQGMAIPNSAIPTRVPVDAPIFTDNFEED
jgi:alpha-tubulin suppressor-like RCC1 family protein